MGPFPPLFGGDEGIRTPDPLLAGQVLSQLSYTPIVPAMLLLSALHPHLCAARLFCFNEHLSLSESLTQN